MSYFTIDGMKVAFYCYNCFSFKPLVGDTDLCARCQEELTKGWPEEEITQPDIKR